MLVLGTSIASAQWRVIQDKDDFGDFTGKERTVMSAVGKFSNTATSNSKASIFVEKSGNFTGFVLSDYADNTNTYYKNIFSITIKKKDGSMIKGSKIIDTYVSGSGYTHLKWITFKPIKYSELTLKELKVIMKAHRKANGGILKAVSWPTAATVEYGKMLVASYGTKTSPLYEGLMNLEQGDKISVRIDDGSKYLFEL